MASLRRRERSRSPWHFLGRLHHAAGKNDSGILWRIVQSAKLRRMFAAVILSMILSSSAAGRLDAAAVARGLEMHYHNARTLQAVFLERFTQDGQTVRVESGTVYFSKPGRMRWDYQSPQEKLFLVDGKNAWLYIPADRTASRQPVKESDDWRTPLALLTGRAELSRFCGSVELLSPQAAEREDRPSTPGNYVLRCSPRTHGKDEPPFQSALLEVDPEFRLVRVLVRQAGSQDTEFRFGDWKENIPLEELKFHFAPPPGVAIVEAPQLIAPGS
jgi:outer membrane lipoprotein carrier protein